MSRCRTRKGKWDGDTVMFPGKVSSQALQTV